MWFLLVTEGLSSLAPRRIIQASSQLPNADSKVLAKRLKSQAAISFIQKEFGLTTKGPPQTAPRLDLTQSSRIIVYPGSFNPPHREHLHLLNHVFYHEVPDLNVVSAIGSVLQICIQPVLYHGRKPSTNVLILCSAATERRISIEERS